MEPSCNLCAFFVPLKTPQIVRSNVEQKDGNCHRMPPVVVNHEGQLQTVWPTVDLNEACGEFCPIEDATGE